jgi:hypothetical protein
MSFLTEKANEILERADRIPYNPNWTLSEQNQIHAARELAKAALGQFSEEKLKALIEKQAAQTLRIMNELDPFVYGGPSPTDHYDRLCRLTKIVYGE